MRESAIKGVGEYARRVYTHEKGMTLYRRGSSRSLEAGEEFYIRPAGSSPGKFRVVFPSRASGEYVELTLVYSVDGDQADVLIDRSMEA